MKPLTDTLAKVLMGLSHRLMPNSLKGWADAMALELHHIPSSDRMSFALGCCKSSIIERFNDMLKTKDILFIPALFGCAFFALICLINGVRLASDEIAVATVLLTASLLWTATYCAFLFRSKIGVLRAAATGLFVYLGLGIANLTSAPAFEPNSAFFGAFALEGIALAATTIGFALLPFLWTTKENEA